MRLGMPLAEYERSIGPKNQFFHELAEYVILARQGVIDPDEDGGGEATMAPDTHGRS